MQSRDQNKVMTRGGGGGWVGSGYMAQLTAVVVRRAQLSQKNTQQ